LCLVDVLRIVSHLPDLLLQRVHSRFQDNHNLLRFRGDFDVRSLRQDSGITELATDDPF
jgi:hypothetical protein